MTTRTPFSSEILEPLSITELEKSWEINAPQLANVTLNKLADKFNDLEMNKHAGVLQRNPYHD